jgi:hypothetical protein
VKSNDEIMTTEPLEPEQTAVKSKVDNSSNKAQKGLSDSEVQEILDWNRSSRIKLIKKEKIFKIILAVLFVTILTICILKVKLLWLWLTIGFVMMFITCGLTREFQGAVLRFQATEKVIENALRTFAENRKRYEQSIKEQKLDNSSENETSIYIDDNCHQKLV